VCGRGPIVSAPLAPALSAIEERYGPGAAERLVRRTEVAEDGALLITLEEGDTLRWLRAEAGRVTEIAPEGDPALPAAGALAARARAGAARILSWRPGRRIVARVESPGGARIVKGYRPARFAGALLAHFRAEHRVPPEAFRVPRLLGEEPGLCALVFERVEGSPLDAPAADASTMRDLGRRLARFQRAPAEDLLVHGRAEERAVLARTAARVLFARGQLPEGWSALEERLGALTARTATASTAAHRDLHDGQILCAGDAVSLVDFDLWCRAEPTLDAANLAAHVHLRALERKLPDAAPRARSVGIQLLEGLGRADDSASRESFAFYRASAGLRLALLCALRPAWMPLLPGILHLAREGIEEAERA